VSVGIGDDDTATVLRLSMRETVQKDVLSIRGDVPDRGWVFACDQRVLISGCRIGDAEHFRRRAVDPRVEREGERECRRAPQDCERRRKPAHAHVDVFPLRCVRGARSGAEARVAAA